MNGTNATQATGFLNSHRSAKHSGVGARDRQSNTDFGSYLFEMESFRESRRAEFGETQEKSRDVNHLVPDEVSSELDLDDVEDNVFEVDTIPLTPDTKSGPVLKEPQSSLEGATSSWQSSDEGTTPKRERREVPSMGPMNTSSSPSLRTPDMTQVPTMAASPVPSGQVVLPKPIAPPPIAAIPVGAKVSSAEAVKRPEAIQRTPMTELQAQIFEKLRLSISKDRARAEIHLDPKNLGRVSVEIVEQGGKLNALLRTEHPHATEAIQRLMTEIKELFRDAGVNLDQFEVREEKPPTHEDSESSRRTHDDSGNAGDPLEEERRHRVRASNANSLVDVWA